MRLAVLIFFLFIFSNFNSFSQKTHKGLPKDLDKETIIFFEYEQTPIDEEMTRSMKRMYKKRNEISIRANKILRSKVKKYPFKYVVSKRSEYKNLTNNCKYILESDLMEAANNGVNLYAGYKKEYVSDLFVKDIRTGDKYILHKIGTSQIYQPQHILRRFYRKVKSNYRKQIKEQRELMKKG